ncbi:uncharacterized protein JN550_002528 [Neoarthrinium moseri]|uniref:uncharacterized protein n=1 Tax=Neoarthrinium moseri TaxID=1658444 RepID=UPI001FDDDC1C|nr:uncharacterized protein JN550_002528 [Neoarthrinium moseri]KAI1875099.1 hypothetical protein JN550_002528 [Neoarthrinium moseri]
MSGYPPSGPPPFPHGEASQQPNHHQWQPYQSPSEGSPYPGQGSPVASPHQGSHYGPFPGPPPHQHPQYGPPQPQYADSPPPAGQYPPSPGYGYGYTGQHQAQPYHPPSSPYQPPAQPQYAATPPAPHGYPPEIKHEYSPTPPMGQPLQTEEQRGLMGALAGGAAGAFAGHKVNHGLLGALGGAFAGHKLQDAYKDHKKHSRPSSRRSSSSSSSSSTGHSHTVQRPPQHQAPPVVHGTKGNYSQSSSRISLDNDHDLIAECADINGSRKLSSISLNRLLTNDDGHFRWSREGNFAASARNVRLIHGGKFLEAELCSCNGSWRRDQICLDERIENSNGNLQMLW